MDSGYWIDGGGGDNDGNTDDHNNDCDDDDDGLVGPCFGPPGLGRHKNFETRLVAATTRSAPESGGIGPAD